MGTTRTRIGIIVVAIALIAGLVQGPASAAAPSPRVPELAGVTTFTADQSGSMLVRVPDGLGDPRDWDLKARFSGTGRVMAFVLVLEDWEGRERRTPMIVGQRFGDCTEVACTRHPWTAGSLWANGVMPSGDVPGGLYRLYVVADGAPVTTKLVAPMLRGRITLKPTGPAQVEIRTLTPIHELLAPLDEVASRLNLYSAGAKAPFEGPGYSSLRAWWRSDIKPAGMFGLCTYQEDPLVEAVAYLPGACRNTFVSDPYVYPTPIEDGYGTLEAHWNYLPAAFGFWNLSAAPTNDVGSVAFWLRTP